MVWRRRSKQTLWLESVKCQRDPLSQPSHCGAVDTQIVWVSSSPHLMKRYDDCEMEAWHNYCLLNGIMYAKHRSGRQWRCLL